MFHQGKEYLRRSIHQKFGGQLQTGICTPANHPFIFIFSGKSGERYGYSDGWSTDGIFNYTGEGRTGNMRFVRGNAAIRDHINLSRDIHLFSHIKNGMVRYIGQFFYTGHRILNVANVEGSTRSIIVFELTPYDQLETEFESIKKYQIEGPIDVIRKQAIDQSGIAKSPKERLIMYRARSEAIKRYALRRAHGVCEGCNVKAPFYTIGGLAFLEVHHIFRLSDGGPDHPQNVIAICPNCHRRAHYSADALAFNKELKKIVDSKESCFNND